MKLKCQLIRGSFSPFAHTLIGLLFSHIYTPFRRICLYRCHHIERMSRVAMPTIFDLCRRHSVDGATITKTQEPTNIFMFYLPFSVTFPFVATTCFAPAAHGTDDGERE